MKKIIVALILISFNAEAGRSKIEVCRDVSVLIGKSAAIAELCGFNPSDDAMVMRLENGFKEKNCDDVLTAESLVVALKPALDKLSVELNEVGSVKYFCNGYSKNYDK
jgi:hypothetical protein